MNETRNIVTPENTAPAALETPIAAPETETPNSETETTASKMAESPAEAEVSAPADKEEEMDPICMPPEAQEKRQKWSSFVEGPAVDFFTGYKLEKMTIDDGNGNKAKFSRTKDSGIKIEYTSSVLL